MYRQRLVSTDGLSNIEHNQCIGKLCFRQRILRRSAHRDARASRRYSKTNMAHCALSCLPDEISEQYFEWQLTLRQRQMADLYSRKQCFRSVKIYKNVTVFDMEARCFRSQLNNKEPHRVFLSSMRVTWMRSRNQQPSAFRTALKYTRNVYKLQSMYTSSIHENTNTHAQSLSIQASIMLALSLSISPPPPPLSLSLK